MAEWQEQLNTILSDPEAMAQIAALAQSISGGDGTKRPGSGADAPPREKPAQGAGVDPDALHTALGGLDPELLRRLGPLMEQFNRPESSEATTFLMALRPFLSEARRGKVERAAQLARLVHLGKVFLTTQGQEASGRV
ncbi:MAG: hypothetical protein E7474_02415 [Ruminococcaceae bacterium]|nr:hypothetical protein [Oscillospiraceae bacterium]